MQELLPGIHRWTSFSEKFQYDFNGWLVDHPDGNLVIDPVTLDDPTLAALTAHHVARIVITNRNHYRDAERLRSATGARVLVHPADASFVREKGVTVDGALAAGDRVGPFTVLAAPGKSPGEIALHWPERRILVVGDACVSRPSGELGLLPAAVIDDLPGLQATLRRLHDRVEFDALLVGDGVPLVSGGKAALGRLVASFS